jgi:hypothetical protein
MSRFFIKLFVYLLAVGGTYLFFQYRLTAKNDPYYWKSVYRANTLILGGSRALKGISPQKLKAELNLKGEVLNLAFTGVQSPYGKLYLELIKRKIKQSDDASYLFVLSVNPGLLMNFADLREPRESYFPFYKLWSVNAKPNIEYLFRHPREGRALLTTLVLDPSRSRGGREVYRDGYAANFLPDNFARPENSGREKLLKYDMRQSAEREQYLSETVAYLSALGPVYLVRLPVSNRMLKEEQAVYPGFNEMIQRVARNNTNTYYLDYTTKRGNFSYRFTDGNQHLEGSSALLFTQQLANDIKNVHEPVPSE